MLENVRNINRENFQTLLWFATDQSDLADPSWTTPIDYRFNSRGFRDHEWPDNLDHVIWCIGGSELLGTGVAFDQACPRQLAQLTESKVIDVSIIGASNDWITRQFQNIKAGLGDSFKTALIQWSFSTRSELSLNDAKDQELIDLYNAIKMPNWPDIKGFDSLSMLDDKIRQEIIDNPYFAKISAMDGAAENGQIHYKKEFVLDYAGAKHLLGLIDKIESIKGNTQVIYSFCPKFAEPGEDEFIYGQLRDKGIDFIPEYPQIDMARDRSHSGPATHLMYAKSVLEKIK